MSGACSHIPKIQKIVSDINGRFLRRLSNQIESSVPPNLAPKLAHKKNVRRSFSGKATLHVIILMFWWGFKALVLGYLLILNVILYIKH
jgi:hypothetical protein